MKNLQQFFIDGQWVSPASDQHHQVINPATAEPVASIVLGNEADAERAITAARRAFPAYSISSREQRLELLASIRSVYKSRMAEVAEAICTEMGAPLAALALPVQAGTMLSHLKIVSQVLDSYSFHEDLGTTRIQREPIGVCAMITPWNWPIHQIGCKVVPALAAGCTMVLKPSEFAPLSAHVFADILRQAGVPQGVFNLVDGDGPSVGAMLACHPEIDFISFTGSTRAGVQVSAAAAATVKKVALELGGKSPNILLDDANFEKAVSAGMAGMLLNTGQNCNAPSRMLVPRARLAEVETLAAAAAAKAVVGDPTDPLTRVGPLANEAQFVKVQELIGQGIDEGAKLVCGGLGKPDGVGVGFFVRPTVFSQVSNHMTIARQEIFGPVLSIIPYDEEDQAVEIANDTPFGLSAYVSSANLQRAQAVANRLRTGNVHINGAPGDFAATFGGYKQSGLGREWGRHGFEEYLEIKSVFGFQPR